MYFCFIYIKFNAVGVGKKTSEYIHLHFNLKKN